MKVRKYWQTLFGVFELAALPPTGPATGNAPKSLDSVPRFGVRSLLLRRNKQIAASTIFTVLRISPPA